MSEYDNPKTGFSPHGTPESSLGVTASSSSDGVRRPMPKRALPAAPALPMRRERSPNRSRQRSEGSVSNASGDTGSSESYARIRSKKLRARVELKRAELELAEAEEDEALERESKRSDDTRSRSSRGNESRLSARVLRERERDMRELQEESLNRFKATQASGNTTRELSPVAEDQSDETKMHALQSHSLSGHAKPSHYNPADVVHQGWSENPVSSTSPADYGRDGDGVSACGETNPYLTATSSVPPDDNGRNGQCSAGDESNPYLNVFVKHKSFVPASDSGSEHAAFKKKLWSDVCSNSEREVPELMFDPQLELMDVDMIGQDQHTLSTADQENNSGTTMIGSGAQSYEGHDLLGINPNPTMIQQNVQINQNTVIQETRMIDLSQTLNYAEERHQQVVNQVVHQAEVSHSELLAKERADTEARIRFLEEQTRAALAEAEVRIRAAESAAMSMRREAHARHSELEADANARVVQAYQRGLQDSRAGSTTAGSEAGQSQRRSTLLDSPVQTPRAILKGSINPIEFSLADPCDSGAPPNGPVVQTQTVTVTTMAPQTQLTSQKLADLDKKTVSQAASSSSGHQGFRAGGQQPSGYPPAMPQGTAQGGSSSTAGAGGSPPNAGSKSNNNQGGNFGQQPPGGDGGGGDGPDDYSRVPSEASAPNKKSTKPDPTPPDGGGDGGGGGGDGSDDGLTIDFADARSVDSKVEYHHVHRIKEQDEVKIKDFPNAVR